MENIKTILLGVLFLSISLFVEAQNWSQIGSDINGIQEGEHFGCSLDMSEDGSIIAVGARDYDSPDYGAGRVRVLQNQSGVWTQLGNDIVGLVDNEYSGYDISLSDDGFTLAIGNVKGKGSVRIFHYDGGSWLQIGSDIIGDNYSDHFGRILSLNSDGSIVAIGAYGHDGTNGSDAGQVKRYQNQGGTWVQLGSSLEGANADDQFGLDVDINNSGNIVAVGAYQNDAGGSNSGQVRIYEDTGGGNLTQIGAPIDGHIAEAHFGSNISLSADGYTVAIGTDESGNGYVETYTFEGGAWVKVGNTIYGTNGETFGHSVSLSADGSRLAVGAPHGPSTGHVYLYKNNGTNWLLANSVISGSINNDNLGYTACLSDDASVLAGGAAYSDIYAASAGQVRVFRNNQPCLVAQYSFNGNVTDETDNGHNGYWEAGKEPTITSDRFGDSNSAYQFDGDQEIKINHHTDFGSNEITFSLWFKTDDLMSHESLLEKNTAGNGNHDFKFYKVDNAIKCELEDGTNSFQFSAPIADQWNYIVFTSNGIDEHKFYLNGELIEVKDNSWTIMGNTRDILLGNGETTGYEYHGKLDDVHIYQCVLSPEEINSTYHENGWACMIANYPFNGNADDESVNNNFGTVNGATLTQDRFGNDNSAYYFDNSDNISINVDYLPTELNNEYTFSAWIKPDENVWTGGWRTIIFMGENSPNEGTQLEYQHPAVDQYRINHATYSNALDITKDGELFTQWHHVVAVYNGTTRKTYLDGVLLGEDSFSSLNITNMSMMIGHREHSFLGSIDDVRIYACALDSNIINEIYHESGWGYPLFESECLDFNEGTIPENWEIMHGDSAFFDNGRFITAYNPDGGAEIDRMGTMPDNLDSVIIEWDSQISSTQASHVTAIGLSIQDTVVFFGHSQSINYDYGVVVVPSGEQGDGGEFMEKDSIAIIPGIYKNRLVCTNSAMYFTSYKISNDNIIPFEFEINPFDLDANYSIEHINNIIVFLEASQALGYNWIDNVCIELVERNADENCELATYRFNTNVADNSGNGYHLTVENGPVSFVPDRFGNNYKAIHLTDNNQELYTQSTTIEKLLGDFTVSTWVKPAPLNGTDTCLIFSNYDGYGGEMMMLGILEATGKIFYGHVNGGDFLFTDITDFSIPTDVWSHLVLTRDTLAKQYTLYFNGDSVRTYDYPIQPTYSGGSSAYAFSSSEPNFNYEGDIDGTRVWKCVAIPEVVDSIYHIGGWPQVMCNDLTINVTPHDAACGLNNGTAEVTVSGGSQVYNISWSNGDVGFSSDELEAGMHSVQVTDSIYGCMLNQFFNIDNTGAPEVVFNSSYNNCYGASIGTISSIITEGTSPYTIEWSNGETTADIENLSAGTYIITVVDANGCMISKQEIISQPEEITAEFQITNSSCGNNDGEIIVTPSGGMGDYTYNWENGTTDSTNSNLTAGVYSVTVEDMFNCQEVFIAGFSDSGSPMAMVDSTVSASCGELGSLYISVSGGSGSYDYNWSNGEESEDLVGFAPGDYWLTVTDGTCSTMLNAEIPLITPQTQEICVVTVDPTTATNLVVWEKAQETGVDHYNIYREGFVAGEYELVGTVPYNDMSEFSDPVANPFTRSWKYKISAEDACGNESELSSDHKTIHLNINLGLGGSINLIWDDYAGFNYNTFYINRHTTADGWVVIDSLPTYLHSYTDTPPDLYGLWYSVTVAAPGQCIPTSAGKATGGPYYQSSSNIEDEGSIDTKVTTFSEEFHVSLFPNPNNGRFMIGFGESVSGTVSVIDISGKTILFNEIENQDKWINDDTLEKGIYLIKLNIENEGIQIIKMIVE